MHDMHDTRVNVCACVRYLQAVHMSLVQQHKDLSTAHDMLTVRLQVFLQQVWILIMILIMNDTLQLAQGCTVACTDSLLSTMSYQP